MGIFSKLFSSADKVDSLVEDAKLLKIRPVIPTQEVLRISKALDSYLQSRSARVLAGGYPMPLGRYSADEIYRITKVLGSVYILNKDKPSIPETFRPKLQQI